MRSANCSDGDLNKEAAQLDQDVGDIYCKREIQNLNRKHTHIYFELNMLAFNMHTSIRWRSTVFYNLLTKSTLTSIVDQYEHKEATKAYKSPHHFHLSQERQQHQQH